MHRLPPDFDGEFLVGRLLEQVCFNENQVSFRFDDDVAITIEGAYSYQDNSLAVPVPTIHVPAATSNLMQLLGHSVSSVKATQDGTLLLFFDNDHVLRCFDTPNFESYQIRHGAHVIIV